MRGSDATYDVPLVVRRLAELPTLLVMGVAAAGLATAATGRWRLGVLLVGASMVAAAVLRLVLPARTAGLLVVRGRLLDALMMLGLGLATMVLVLAVPD